jgi:hypothetical protein
VDSFGREPGGDSRKSNDPGDSDDSDNSGDPDIQIKGTRDRVRALVQLENRDAFIISRWREKLSSERGVCVLEVVR